MEREQETEPKPPSPASEPAVEPLPPYRPDPEMVTYIERGARPEEVKARIHPKDSDGITGARE